MDKKMFISDLFIEELDNKVRVCSNIKSDKPEYKLWFEVDKEMRPYILEERLDAFVVAVLPYAIKKELDIYVEGKISERLYYQLSTYIIPLLCNKLKKRIISINAELDNTRYNIGKAVGTGISCGVDSLYTVAKHTNREEENFNITHLVLCNSGGYSSGDNEITRKYNEHVELSKKFAENNGFKSVLIDCNISEFLMMFHPKTHTFKTLSCILVLQKLFNIYYFSSGIEFDKTCINESDTAYYDVLNTQCLSTEDITFYSTGMETNRLGKVKVIAEYEPSYTSLNVCLHTIDNCGECNKCRRTLLQLDSIGKLDLYNNVFDINKFRKNRNKFWLLMLRMCRDRKDKHREYYLDAYNEYNKRNICIPIHIKLLSYIPDKNTIKREIRSFILKFMSREKFNKLRNKNPQNDGWE